MNNNLQKIIVVFKTHFDIGFTDLPTKIKKFYLDEMIPQVIDVCFESARKDKAHLYTWTIPSWPLRYFLNNSNGKNIENINFLIKNRQIRWHALPFTVHTEFMGLEDFIRGMYISKNLDDRYGCKTASAKMTDVPGHTWILPSLLKQAGVEFLHLGCNACSTPPDVPRLFYWEGPDGNKILTFYSKGGYGSELFPPDDWHFPIWLALIHTGDNQGSHKPEIIADILNQVKLKSPNTEVIFGGLDDFYEEISKTKLDIPIIKKDLADTWIHGIGSYPRQVSAIRENRRTMLAIESAICFASVNGITPGSEIKSIIQKAYENLLLFSEHTWGIDTKIALKKRQYEKEAFIKEKEKGEYNLAIKSWREKMQYSKNVTSYVNKLTSYCEDSLRSRNGNKGIKNEIQIYNPLGFTRNGLIEITNIAKKGFNLYDLVDGQESKLIKIDHKIFAEVTNIPPLSSKEFKVIKSYLKEKKPDRGIAFEDKNKLGLKNNKITLVLDRQNGNFLSLRKNKSQELIDTQSELGFCKYLYSIYSKEEIEKYLSDYCYDREKCIDWYPKDFGKPGYPDIVHKDFEGKFKSARIENYPHYGQIKIEYENQNESVHKFGNGVKIILKIILFEDSDYLDIELNINHKEPTFFLEGGYLIFSLNLKKPKFAVNKTGSVVDPTIDIAKDANHVLYSCENWVDIYDEENGLLFITYDAPLLSIGEPGIERYSKDYVPKKSVVFFNLFNNQWGTNFPQWIEGNFKYKFRIIPHDGNWKDAKVWKRTSDSLIPLVKLSKSFVKNRNILKRDLDDDIEIVNFKIAEQGENYILRLREISGENRKEEFEFDKEIKTLYCCDLLERLLYEIPLKNSKNCKFAKIELKPFEIKTLMLIF